MDQTLSPLLHYLPDWVSRELAGFLRRSRGKLPNCGCGGINRWGFACMGAIRC